MSQQSFFSAIDKDSEEINHFLKANLDSHVHLISQVGQHILLGGGKRIRPMLFAQCARLAGYRGDKALYFSTLFEYLHAATLLHDDVIDNAEMRRGSTSANVLWGNCAAVLVGDFLFSKSFHLAVEIGNLRLLEALSTATNRMAEGMILELVHSFDFDLSFEDYLEIVVSKTAVLISAACRTGGMMGDLTHEQEDLLGEYGMELGIAFQMVDDALDYCVSEEEFGKPVGKDVLEGKITLPLMYAMERATDEERERIRYVCAKERVDSQSFQQVRTIVNRYEGVEHCLRQAAEHTDRAKSFLNAFPDGEGREILTAIANFVVERRF